MKDVVYIPVSLELVSLINQIKGKDMSVEEFLRELIADYRLKEISLKSIICEAIEGRKYLKFVYEGGERIVEPYLLGIDKKGKMKLSGYQIEGYSKSGQPEGWKLFRVYDIECLQLLDKTFEKVRKDYNPEGYPYISEVVCRI